MTERLTLAELRIMQGAPPRQLSLFKSKRQRGTQPPPALEFKTACMVADTLKKCAAPGWWWSSIPLGEYRTPATAGRLKRMGVRPGLADMLLISPDGEHCWLELKRRGSKCSSAQEAFAAFCRSARITYEVAHGYDEARETLLAWGAVRGSL